MAATPAKVKRLADELIVCITGLTPDEDPENFNICRGFALRNFKGYKFARTNQFNVNSKLEGLEEKFRIFNRDDIADALRSRLNELPTQTFTPELLSLFIALSDRPLENSHLDDLDALIKPEDPKGITWADIIANEPLEGEIWNDVDFGAESSDEWSDDSDSAARFREEIMEKEQETEGRKRKFKWGVDGEEERGAASVQGFIVEGDKDGLKLLKKAQYWGESEKVKPVDEEIDVSLGSGGVENISIISEVQSLREVLFMLLGHPCVLFRLTDEVTVSADTTTLSSHFALRHSSLLAFQAILSWYAEKGTNLNRIRKFTKTMKKSDSPEQQAFTAAIVEKVAVLEHRLVEIEQCFVGNNNKNQVASLIALQYGLEPHLHPYMLLSSIIDNIIDPSNPRTPTALATAHLELLFNSSCSLQSIGDYYSFNFMSTLFFSCLQTYLRPIRAWMERGELRNGDPSDEIFLIAKTRSDDEVELGGLWQEQYSLRRDNDHVLQAPGFVHAVADRIFITGKSVVFLKRLVEHELPPAMFETDAANSERKGLELTVDSVCGTSSGGEDNLAPFEDVFATTFDRWINDRHHSVSSRLRDILYRDCGLWKSLDALEYVYLCSDGYLFDILAVQVFEKIDKGVQTWGDRFLLTELVQGVYGGVGCIDAKRLRMRGKKDGVATLRERRKSVKVMKEVEVDYALPWPIMNVIRKEAFEVYKAIFTLLLQIRRAQCLLTRLSMLKDDFRRFGENGEGAMYYSLKHRLLWFANTIYYYLTDLVLLPQTAKMRTKMAEALDVDGMISVHSTYINKIKDQCLLGPKLAPIHQTIITLLDISITFSDTHTARAGEIHYAANNGDESMRDVSVLVSTPRRHRRAEDSEDEDEDHDTEEGEQDHDLSYQEEGYKGRLVAASAKFNAMLDFVKAGLRGVARAGVMPHLETLAEGLDGVGWEGRYG